MAVKLFPFSSLTLSDKGLVLSIHPSTSWMDPIVAYLQKRILLKVRKSPSGSSVGHHGIGSPKKGNYIKGHIYSEPYLLNVYPKTVETLLEELHEGICASHTRGSSLAPRALT